MLDQKMAAMIEQGRATMIEYMPPLWRGLYEASIREGFSQSESLELLKAYILSQCPHGVNGGK